MTPADMTMRPPTLFRLRFEEQGAHTHVRVFAGRGSLSLGLCGALVFRNEEWADFYQEVNRDKAGSSIEFVRETETMKGFTK